MHASLSIRLAVSWLWTGEGNIRVRPRLTSKPSSCKRDPLSLRTFVTVLWTLETAAEVVTWTEVLMPFYVGLTSEKEVHGLLSLVMHRTWLASVVTFLTQIFFLRRIFVFTGGKGWPIYITIVLVFILAVFTLIGTLAYVISNLYVRIAVTRQRMVSLALAIRLVPAFVDIVLAFWMGVLLNAHRRHPTFGTTNRLLQRLILLSISTGGWTALVALVDFALIAWRPDSAYFLICEFPLASLYTNMVLANLNARRGLRTDGSNAGAADHNDPILLPQIRRGGAHIGRTPTAIRVDTETAFRSDAGSMEGDKPCAP